MSAQDESKTFQKLLEERTPSAIEASKKLQAVMAIAPGTKMTMDGLMAIPWEMPDPPSCSKQTFIERWQQGVADEQFAELAEEDEDDGTAEQLAITASEDEEEDDERESEGENDGHAEEVWLVEKPVVHAVPQIVVDSPVDEAEQQLKRKREASQPPKPQPRKNLGQGPLTELTDIALPERPAAKHVRQRHPELQQSLMQTNQEPNTKADTNTDAENAPPPNDIEKVPPPNDAALLTTQLLPATPPPLHEFQNSPFSKKARPPLYWSPTLSDYLHEWLQVPGTKSTQTPLSSLTLRKMPGPGQAVGDALLIIDAYNYEKVKMIRMTLPPPPPGAQFGSAGALLLDWFIVVIVSQGLAGDGFNSDSELEEGEDEDDLPFWIMAFPTCQVTAAKLETCKGQMYKEGQRGFEDGQKRVTKLLLGKQQRVPLTHGYGIDERFGDDFMKACVEGKGLVEMVSEEDVPLKPW